MAGLVELRRRGKARAIGVSNFSVTHIEQLRAAGLPMPTSTRSSSTPGLRSPSWSGTSKTTRSRPSPTAALSRSPHGEPAQGQESAKTEQMKAEGEQTDAPFQAPGQKIWRERGTSPFALGHPERLSSDSEEHGPRPH